MAYRYTAVVFVLGKIRKRRDLTQSYDKSAYTQKYQKREVTTEKRHQKLRFHNDRPAT